MDQFNVNILPENDFLFNEQNDNVDVEITLVDGRKFAATFFTLNNIDSLFNKNKVTGECNDGLYFWASDMLLVKKINKVIINKVISDLIENDELESALTEIILKS